MRTIVTTMRNEAPFILEWLAYHRAIGFTDFLVFSNDCEDGTDLMLDRLQEHGILTHLRNPRQGKRPVQWAALKQAASHPLVTRAGWIFVADVDEFLNIHVGEGRLDDLFAARPAAEGFMLSWRMFGSQGRARFVDQPVIAQFTAAAPAQMIWPWRAVQFKTLYRNRGPMRKMGVHAPARAAQDPALFVDDNGAPVGEVTGTVLLHTAPRYGLAQINHYALGSAANFLVKCARGKPNHADQAIDLAYWLDRNINAVEDRSILRHAEATAQGVAAFLGDPVLQELHQQAVAWRLARIDALLLQSDYFYLYARIMQAATTAPLPLDRQQSMLQQLFRMRRAQMAAETG